MIIINKTGGARAFSNTASAAAGKVTQVIGAVVDVQVRDHKKLMGYFFAYVWMLGSNILWMDEEGLGWALGGNTPNTLARFWGVNN